MASLAPAFRPDPPPPVTSPIEATLTAAARQDDRAREDRTPFFDWSLKVPEAKSGPLDFHRFPYLRELYSQEVADAEEIAVQKSTQVGITTWAFRLTLYDADTRSYTGLYIFPTEDHVYDFSDERIEPAIKASQYLLDRIEAGTVRNKGLKQIGRGFVYLRGSKSKSGAQSIAADSLVFDEYDELDKVNLPQLERRVSGAEGAGRIARVRRMGVPSIPGFGINKEFVKSDQRKWHVTCKRKKCSTEQELTFKDNVRWKNKGDNRVFRQGQDDPEGEVERAWRCCEKCGTEIDVSKGRWIATNPDASMVGYHVPRLIVPNTNLITLVNNSRKTAPEEVTAFYNNDLGLPYSPSEASLSRIAILGACGLGGPIQEQSTNRMVKTMGVDVAGSRPLTGRISEQLPDGRRRAVWIGEIESFKGVIELIERFNVTMCAIDANPDSRSSRAVAATFPGRVVLVEYADRGQGGSDPEPLVYDPDKNKVRIARTLAIDATMDAIRQLRNLPLRQPPQGYVEHLMAVHRRTEEDTKGNPVRRYYSVGPDDYLHTEVYDLAATEVWRLVSGYQAQQAEDGTEVPDEELGFRRVPLDAPHDDYDPGFGGQ